MRKGLVVLAMVAFVVATPAAQTAGLGHHQGRSVCVDLGASDPSAVVMLGGSCTLTATVTVMQTEDGITIEVIVEYAGKMTTVVINCVPSPAQLPGSLRNRPHCELTSGLA